MKPQTGHDDRASGVGINARYDEQGCEDKIGSKSMDALSGLQRGMRYPVRSFLSTANGQGREADYTQPQAKL